MLILVQGWRWRIQNDDVTELLDTMRRHISVNVQHFLRFTVVARLYI